MSYIIISLAFISMLHFIYSGVILPSIRLCLRNKLFVLRDELRNLKIEKGQNIDQDAFNFLHDGITNFLNRLHQLTISMFVSVTKELENDPKLKQRIESRLSVIENCEDQQLQKIFIKTNKVVKWAFIANMGDWMIYIIPIALLINSISKLMSFLKEMLAIPIYDAGRLMPEGRMA